MWVQVLPPGAPARWRTETAGEAHAEITRAGAVDLAARALPDLIPLREPPAEWARPGRRPPAGDTLQAQEEPSAPAAGAEAGPGPGDEE